MSKKLTVLVPSVLLALALLYTAMPLWASWQLRQAMKSRDIASLEARVDWPTLRANLKPRIAQIVNEEAERSAGVSGVLKRAIGSVLADRGVDYAVTPKTLSRILAGREFIASRAKKEMPSAPTQPPSNAPGQQPSIDAEDPDDPVPPRRLRWAFFESPSRFRIEAIHPRLPNNRIVAILARDGVTWKLADIDLINRTR
jgi:hypothetical protein